MASPLCTYTLSATIDTRQQPQEEVFGMATEPAIRPRARELGIILGVLPI